MKILSYGNKANPTVLFIHGFQSPYQVWTPFIEAFKEKYHIDYSVRFVVKLLDLALHIMEIYENNEHLEYVSSNFLKKIYSSNTSGEYKIISADITIVDSLMFDISNIEDDILITDKLNSFKAILVRYLG